MTIVGHLEMPSDQELLARLNLEKGGLVQRVIDSEVIRWCTDYVPMDEGILTQSAYTATQVGSGMVCYDTPYARYQYYGISHSGNPLHYQTEKHPLAGSYWFERAMADHKEDVLQAAREAVRR